ncbi:MAG: DUF4910 domain-containing protein [Anaerolineae bacterium]|jgi:aminopeptidase-like protein|nr:DUF4910 domain-containing protein [Anaerolineae bacterium]
MSNLGQQMHALAARLFPICRSITGSGFRESLNILKEHLPGLVIHEVPTGTKCFDWTVPKEWNIRDAYLIDPNGEKRCDFQQHNLHVMGYSTPVDEVVTLDELQKHLYSLPDQPNAIPYITSYYKERWGFCITEEERQTLPEGEYHVVIDSQLEDGHLTYGELVLPGESEKEIFLSTYLCHPSMANNELSGPVVATFLVKWLMSLPQRKYTIRLVIIPETIGSITYLSRNLAHLQQHVIAGFNLTCVGDDRAYSYLPSRAGNTLADQAALHVLQHLHPDFIRYEYADRGSDERQYCSPGVDLPLCLIMRTKFQSYPEYHTSLDDLSLVTPEGLYGTYEVLQQVITCIENAQVLRTTVLCEPQLGKRGLYPTISTKQSAAIVRDMMNIIAYSDGTRNSIALAEKIGVYLPDVLPTIQHLLEEGVLIAAEPAG